MNFSFKSIGLLGDAEFDMYWMHSSIGLDWIGLDWITIFRQLYEFDSVGCF